MQGISILPGGIVPYQGDVQYCFWASVEIDGHPHTKATIVFPELVYEHGEEWVVEHVIVPACLGALARMGLSIYA